MFGSETLDVAIGLVLIFLMVSLVLTAVTEAIEAILKTRAADLERAVESMLTDPDAASAQLREFYEHPLVFALYRGAYEKRKNSWFFKRPSGGDLPSYIPRDLFAAAAIDLADQGVGSDRLRLVVETYRRLYGPQTERLRANLESWYDGVMDRAAGWYKRRTQKLLFWLGLSAAIVLNINPFAVAQHLAATPEARAQMVLLAERVLQAEKAREAKPGQALAPSGQAALPAPSGSADQAAASGAPNAVVPTNPKSRAPEISRPDWQPIVDMNQAIRDAGLPVGWSDLAVSRTFPTESTNPWAWLLAGFIALAGWGITALAAMLGAPFWFDVLNKIMVIRATVKPREKSGDEASEDRTSASAAADAAGKETQAGTGVAAAPRPPALDDGAVG